MTLGGLPTESFDLFKSDSDTEATSAAIGDLNGLNDLLNTSSDLFSDSSPPSPSPVPSSSLFTPAARTEEIFPPSSSQARDQPEGQAKEHREVEQDNEEGFGGLFAHLEQDDLKNPFEALTQVILLILCLLFCSPSLDNVSHLHLHRSFLTCLRLVMQELKTDVSTEAIRPVAAPSTATESKNKSVKEMSLGELLAAEEVDEARLRTHVYAHGVQDDQLRATVWRLLLDYMPYKVHTPVLDGKLCLIIICIYI